MYSTANLQKRQKIARLFLAKYYLAVSRTFSKNVAFPDGVPYTWNL